MPGGFFKNLSTKAIVFILIGLVVVGAAVVTLYGFSLINNIVFTIILIIVLFSFSSFMSILTARAYRKRMINKKKLRKFALLSDKLELFEYNQNYKVNYGTIYIKLDKGTIYNLTFVDDPKMFFSENQEQAKIDIDAKKYKHTLQFFIFQNLTTELFDKVSILNYQAKNFYVGSFVLDLENKLLLQTDEMLPNNEYDSLYNQFIEYLSLKEIEDSKK